MRNPVGPLPSSIYWRRRAVAGLLVALLAALIAWAVTSVNGGGTKDDGKPGGSDPVESITPGPGSSGPKITQRPGGRDESEDSEGAENSGGSDGSNGDTSGAGSEGGSGSDTGSGSDGTSTGGADTAGAGGGGTGSGGSAAGRQVPADSPLPECKPGALELTLRTKVSYGPDDRPKFEILARNTSSAACKTDLGPKNVVLTVTEAGEDNDDVIWSSKDCPAAPGPLFFQVPAGATIVHTVDWNRARSAPNCATPPPGKAAPGTYLLEAKAPDTPLRRASFVLKKD
ncbi:hypothetical protein ACFWGE_09605 [Streptomyces bacillaris]|nr:hypothetical protein [Streptomyces cavourensis]TQO30966.1 hypothetical protein FHX79_112809 [Streptomyces cavourensis]UTR83485.1 hypothetical protein NLU04_31685 [Streptomyces cavourensis]WAE70389.1 hypothetical protein OUQ49_14345 [Streptomyces cavourensis]GGU52553.1 hypothetical protein GCM10010498_07260 [Streptomyces cavourensis]